MARKTSKTAETEQKVQDEVVINEEVREPAKKTVTKKAAPKKDGATEPKKRPVAKKETVKKEVVGEEELLEEEDEVVDNEDGKKKRVTPTRESVISSFDEMIDAIEKEIGVLRDSQNKTKGVKFLRTLGKKLKGLKSQATRIISKRNPTQRKTGVNVSSGFLKPVRISKEIAKFTGWQPSELKSRVQVTKFLCNYIREHNLQYEKDKRQIKPDPKLAKLLNYDEKTAEQPLTYFYLQRLLKNHFPRTEGGASEVGVTA